MEDKLAKYIVNIAGSSYLLLGILFIGVILVFKDNPFGNSLFTKSLIILVVYIISLALIHKSKGKPLKPKAIMWSISLTLHLVIMGYIIYQFGDFAALALMCAECIMLALLFIGITSIGLKIHKGADYNA